MFFLILLPPDKRDALAWFCCPIIISGVFEPQLINELLRVNFECVVLCKKTNLSPELRDVF